MNTLETISKRRSIRKFQDKEIPKEMIEKILDAATQAPSPKNLQPWKFIVVTKSNKETMLQVMRSGIENSKERMKDFPDINHFLASAINSTRVMKEAPITVFVFNTVDDHTWVERRMEFRLSECANTQSIGAAIENMLLAAESLGIGSLWICDIFFAYQEICHWLDEKCQLVAAIALGYADENPNERPRKMIDNVVQWR